MEQIGGILGAAWFLRVEDLLKAEQINGYCYICKHEGQIDLERIVRQWPLYERLTFLSTKLHCTACDCQGDAACTFKIIVKKHLA